MKITFWYVGNREVYDEIVDSATLNDFSRKLFGITFSNANLDLNFEQIKKLDSPEKEEEWEEWKEFLESQITTTDASPEGAVDTLLSLGVDFRSVDGYPLNMTRYLARQAEVAARGIMGKLPDQEKIRGDEWATNMLVARNEFQHTKSKTK